MFGAWIHTLEKRKACCLDQMISHMQMGQDLVCPVWSGGIITRFLTCYIHDSPRNAFYILASWQAPPPNPSFPCWQPLLSLLTVGYFLFTISPLPSSFMPQMADSAAASFSLHQLASHWRSLFTRERRLLLEHTATLQAKTTLLVIWGASCQCASWLLTKGNLAVAT